MRKTVWIIMLAAVLTILSGMNAFAADYTQKGTYRWEIRNGLYYAYDTVTGELIRNCRVGKSYVDKNGTRYLNQFKKGVYYDGDGIAKKKFKGGWIECNGKAYYFKNKKKVTGYQKISGKYYFFSTTGERLSGVYCVNGKYLYFKDNGVQYRKTGWRTISGKRYFLNAGEIIEGFFTVNNKKYYQTVLSGILTGEQQIGDEKHYFKADGVYDEELTLRMRNAGKLGPESDILFFTKFESGNVGYAQTGGDSGKACGKYQFDYRYALIPFLKYCYSADPVFFAGFKKFLNIKPGDPSLIGNKKLYKAWQECYNADAQKFSTMQDKYAEAAYYKPAEDYLAARGVHLSNRPYVIRGAVFSYAIQEGSVIAAMAVIAAKITDSTTDKDFLEKLYKYRWKDPKGWNQNPIFRYRYTQERKLALSLLQAVGST